ncbi:MAG: permease prefix domain 2-containing transporter [Candidatus Sulfotelmatobacter sp.]
MTPQADYVRPPRFATWLLNLFTLSEEESIVGDLLEEFSPLASQSGVAFARRWYWRQCLKTIAHLFGSGFRVAPWSTSAAVVGGYLLGAFLHGLPDKVLSAVTDTYLAYWSTHFQAYMWVLKGMLIAHLSLSMLVGCMVALAAKGREMVATITLSLVLFGLVAPAYFALVAEHWAMEDALSWTLFQCSGPVAIVVGGVIVRMRRSVARTPLSAT